MKKKLFIILLVGLLFITLTGCGKNEEIPNADNGESVKPGARDGETENDEIKLYSDDTKLVFDATAYKMVFYYSGEKITGLEYYVDYQDSATAAYALASVKTQYNEEDNIDSITQNGRYILVKFTEEEYKDLSVEEVKSTFSYFKQINESS